MVQSYSPGGTNVHSHLIHAQYPKQYIDQYSRFCTAHRQEVPIFYFILFPLKIAPSCAGSGPLSNTWFLACCAHPSPYPKWHIERFSHFGRAHDCDRTTDHTTPSVIINRIYIALRCGLINIHYTTSHAIHNNHTTFVLTAVVHINLD